ncbi:MAG: gamma-glutamyltransferase family protein [Desulfosarcinaceae bacterium]|nr:gamma-glutamyltransferase family protein [Desulfosarcinaceae bacterium]
MAFDWNFPYPSQRMPVFAPNVVATSHPLAAQAGLRMLLKGGNAVDAAVATAITLTVVEPTSNGIGGDAFALVWDGSQLHGINGSGSSPAAWTTNHFQHLDAMPELGWDAVTVPGAVDTWVRLSERFGKLPFRELFDPAIDYAQNGYCVSPITAVRWQEAISRYADYPDFGATFLVGGRSPAAGEIFRCPAQARTLEAIAVSDGEAFYNGAIAEKIVRYARETGGSLAMEDLEQHRSQWVAPLTMDFAGCQFHEIPPNGQGLVVLIALGILEHLEINRYPVDSVDSVHLQIEAIKAAFAEAHRHICDPDHSTAALDRLLMDHYLQERADAIDPYRATSPSPSTIGDRGTVYLAAAGANGLMVSMIQSNYLGFGSGLVVPGTGISLHNRGNGFVTDPDHPNAAGPRKRPFHTIIPGFVTCGDQPLMSFGVMGAHMQPQGQVQLAVRMFCHNQNPQTACDAPRWYVERDGQVALEPGFDPGLGAALTDRGHRLMPATEEPLFGGAQVIFRLKDGYCAASDPRKDGSAVGF